MHKIPLGDVNGRPSNSSSCFNLIGDGDTLPGISNGSQGNQIGTGSSLINAQLSDLANNGGATQTMALATTSPANGTGDPALAVNPVTKDPLTNDQRGPGFARVVNGKVDIGAFELQTIVVTTLLDTGNPSGTTSLRQAITQANSDALGDTITFDPSLFTAGPGTITLGSALPTITAKMVITGPGSAELTLKGGGTANPFSVLQVATSGSASVSGLTISDGASTDGGGISNAGQLDLSLCVISGNASTQEGGGIDNTGNMTLTDSTVSGNTSTGDAAGIANTGSLAIYGSTLSGNSASNHGGALLTSGGAALTNTTIYGNTATYGGGIDIIDSGTMVIVNSTISNNDARGDAGGGLDVNGSAVVDLRNTIIAGNFTGSSMLPTGDVNGSVSSDSSPITSSATAIPYTASPTVLRETRLERGVR